MFRGRTDHLRGLGAREVHGPQDARSAIHILRRSVGHSRRRAEDADAGCGGGRGRPQRHRLSLRIGGASALYAAFKDTTLVKKRGRCQSDAFQDYISEARDVAEGVTSKMAAVDLTMV